MSESGRRVFAYPETKAGIPAFFISLILGIMALLVPVALVHTEALAWIFGLGILTWVFLPGFTRYRPIALSEERIEALMAGRPWRTFYWRDVDRIDKRVVPEEFNSEGGRTDAYELLLIKSGRRTITVHSDIREFAALKQRLTEKARRRAIELVLTEPQPLGRTLVTGLDEL